MLMDFGIKKILRDTAYRSLSSEAVLKPLRKMRLGGKAVVLMYHELAPDTEDIEAWTVVRKSDFVRQMEYLSSEFNIVSLRDALRLMNDPARGNGRPMAVVTFDDGYTGNRRILLPAIKSLNIPVTVFVATKAVQDSNIYWYDRLISAVQRETMVELDLNDLGLGLYNINRERGAENWRQIEMLLAGLKAVEPVRRARTVEDILKRLGALRGKDYYKLDHLTNEEVRELSACPLVTIGAHSHCHSILTQLSYEDMRESVKASKLLLEKWTGRDVPYFSYPNGNYDENVIDALKAEGFECSVTTEARAWDRADSVFTIPRIGIGRYDSMDLFKIKVSGGIRNLFQSGK
jgi:peptidoglycan/xylan/chitin deacetylase (PgdA/CDA1 family)